MNCKQLIPGKQAKLTRVVACQGAVQLASAVAAMRTVDGQSTDDVEVENHLLVHDLSAPEGQIEEFARCIFELANKVESWKTQRFVPLADCVRLQSELARKNQRPLCLLSDYTGIENCDQLYVGQNNKFVPTWLRHSFSDAKHICFGDGIAVNFTNTYYRPKEYLSREAKQPWLKRARRGVKSAIKRILGMQSQQNSVEYSTDFDLHCLLLKNLFDQKLSNVTEINARHFMELFESFAEDFSSLAPVAHAELSQLRESPGTNV
ncbi:MAG: hypothetical protein KDB22_00440, partial [Planctomycetales bacterium]|nr:hypothetical protein [Planctomycetales bacterium]